MVLLMSWDGEGWKEAGREYHAQNKQATEAVDNLINMTERQRTIEAMHASESRFRELFDNVMDGVYQAVRQHLDRP